MNVKVEDVMTAQAIVATPSKSVGQVRRLMKRNGVSTLPVVNPDGEPVGIVSASDLLEALPEEKPISQIMTEKVYTIPRYADVHVAARMMRNHRIHHVVVTHEGAVVGVLSTFDLVALVEDHRFVMKNAPTTSTKRVRRRR